MYLLALGLILLVLKYFGVSPLAALDWWWVLAPFALAVLWWWYADASGYSSRKAMEREERRKAERVAESRRRLGLPTRPAKED